MIVGTSIAFAASSPVGRATVCVIVKQGSADGEPIVAQTRMEVDGARFPVPAVEPDIWPIKLATDIVVRGSVYAPSSRAVRRTEAAVRVGAREKRIAVIGDRTAEWTPRGWLFSEPEPFDRMPLTYSRAYGGVDQRLAERLRETIRTQEDLASLLLRETTRRHPGMYPRNPGGTGYVILDEPTAELVRLPNFEDPTNPLSPARFAVGNPARWYEMPVPQGFSWFSAENYPRRMYWGNPPEHAAPDESDELEEIRRGYLPQGFSRDLPGTAVEKMLDWRALNGASPGLVVPYLRGDEHVRLEGLSPSGAVELTLPGHRPRVDILLDGKALDVNVNMHTLTIEPDHGTFSIVWGAHAYAPPPDQFPRILPNTEIDLWDPLEGFTVLVDGVEAPHQMIELPWTVERRNSAAAQAAGAARAP